MQLQIQSLIVFVYFSCFVDIKIQEALVNLRQYSSQYMKELLSHIYLKFPLLIPTFYSSRSGNFWRIPNST